MPTAEEDIAAKIRQVMTELGIAHLWRRLSRAMLLATHDLDLARALCRRVTSANW